MGHEHGQVSGRANKAPSLDAGRSHQLLINSQNVSASSTCAGCVTQVIKSAPSPAHCQVRSRQVIKTRIRVQQRQVHPRQPCTSLPRLVLAAHTPATAEAAWRWRTSALFYRPVL